MMHCVQELSINNIHLITIDNKNIEIYLNLAYAYEAEFSNLTGKYPNKFGICEPDTMPITPYTGYLLYKNDTPIGFCIVEIKEIKDITEFYITPSMRKKNFGYILASTIFDTYPGEWQVRQIQGAENAKSFWRKVISRYTKNNFKETIVNDIKWGIVTCQRFVSTRESSSLSDMKNTSSKCAIHGV